MADVKWIKVATDIFDNRKIRQIETMPDGDAIIVIWIKLLCLAGSINDCGHIYLTQEIPYTDQMLATQFGRPIQVVQLALNVFEKFGMVEIIDDILKISSWERYQNIEGLEKIREQTRIRVARHREKKKLVTLSNVTDRYEVTQGNDIDKNRIDKNREDINNLFEHLWRLYPNKRGKGQVSDAKKKKIYEVGKERMEKAISRYTEDLSKESWRKPQNGSTFFNSGYVDYLDENYSPPERRGNNRFTDYEQRNDIDFDKIEEMLMNKGVKTN